MTEKDAHERRKIFKEELLALKNEKLIDETDYHRMVYAYNLYLQNMEKKNALNRIDSAEPQEDTKRISEKSEGQPQGHDPLKELIQKLKARQEQERKAAQLQAMNVNQVPPVSQTFATQPNAIPPETSMSPPARTINPGFKEPEKNMEQTRERNITWGLILGVILLFIGGLVFGTSQWSSMNNLLKVVMVSLVSVVFFVISFLAERYFKIAKTAFAFLTLGSLFLPISLISIAFFGLLGPYFSVYGEGRYFFGFISSSICLALYMYIAAKYRHRLFVWFSFLTATIATSFLLAMTRLPNDFFYFGLMLYNALLLFVYYKWRRQEKGAIFTKELPLYAQLNLIVSTLLLLFFYENEVFYSFNILLTAALYISMVYINKAKHYHFVFTLLLVYGMYQLIEHSILQSLDYIGFAFIGMLYLLLQKLTTDEHHLGKMFRITSGIISFCAFIFISIQGLLLRSDKDSFVLLAAYLIIAVNYLVLANMTKFSLFRYLAPIFLLTAVWQSYYVLLPGLHGQWLDLYLFAFATAMFALLYVKNEHHYFIVIRRSSFIVSILSMLLSIFLSFANGAFTHMALLLFSFGLISLITYDHTGHVLLQKAAAWGNPISWGLAFLSLFADLKKNVPMYALNAEMMGHCAIGGLLLLAVSLIWKKKRDNSLEVNTFLSGTALYTLGLLFTPFQGHEHPYFTSVIYFVGIAVYVWLVYKRKKPMLWILVSMTSLAFLLSLVHLFEPTLDSQWLTLYNLTIPIMLLAVYEYMGRKINELKPYFFWTAHVHLALSFLFTLLVMLVSDMHPAILIPATAAYVYSTLKGTNEWEIKLFLYAAFSTLPLLLYLHFIYYDVEVLQQLDYLFFLFTALLTIVWLSVAHNWKKRTEWYLIPQSLIGLCAFLPYAQNGSFIHLGIFAVYTLFTLFLLQQRGWKIYSLLPLLLALMYSMAFVAFLERTMAMAVVLILFFAHQLYGRSTVKKLIAKEPKWEIDWYSILAPAYIILLFTLTTKWDPLWIRLIPPFLVVYYLAMLLHRFSKGTAQRIIQTLTALSLLWPYYTIVREFDVHPTIETELIVLPYLILTIYLRRQTWSDCKNVMNRLQTFVLIIIAAILVMDALAGKTIYDAMIIGILSLISLIGGMQFRIKSYFFVGIAVLLLNVLLQTRPLWGNFPWWGYLVLAGLTLIAFAGFNEWQKQKNGREQLSLFQKQKEQWKRKFHDWD